MKINNISLVIGADGLIGRTLSDYLITIGECVIETTRKAEHISDERKFLDLSEDISGWPVPCRASVAYICAAVTKLEDCRENPVQSSTVNVHNTVALAKKLLAGNTFVIFVSTSQVLDGSIPHCKAEAEPCPLTEYGRQKAKAERQLMRLGVPVSVVRFTKVIGTDMPLFKSWFQSLNEGKVIHPYSDMVMSPVPIAFAVDVLHRVAKVRLAGITQVSGESDMTYAEIAYRIARRMGAESDLVQPIRSKESGLYIEALLPNTTLDTTRLRTEIGLKPPEVLSTIDSVIDILISKHAEIMR